MTAPISREAIYLGKFAGNLFFMILVQAIVIPVFGILFNLWLLNVEFLTVTILATIGFAGVGTLFSAMSVNTRARELILPVLFFPVVTPVIIAAVNAASVILEGGSFSGILSWLGIIAAFDMIFLVASYLVFCFIIEE